MDSFPISDIAKICENYMSNWRIYINKMPITHYYICLIFNRMQSKLFREFTQSRICAHIAYKKTGNLIIASDDNELIK